MSRIRLCSPTSFRLAVLFWASTVPAFAASAPSWLSAVAQAPVTVGTKDADAVVLLHEGREEIGRDGERTVRIRRAIRLLNADGKKHAVAAADYLSGSSALKSFKAWLIKPGGEVVAYGKKATADLVIHATAFELYGEARRQVITAHDEADSGAVFGYESVVVGRTLFNQELWRFQSELPTERSAFTLQLPPDWTCADRMMNSAPLPARIEGAQRTWSLGPLDALAEEPMSPSAASLAPWLALDWRPPPKSRDAPGSVSVISWRQLSELFTAKYDAAAAPDEAMRSRVAQLLAGAVSPWEKLQRLGGFVQRVNYISILLDSANAGGYIPRPAARVLQGNYGDCKDKATLLRALLAVAGFKSHPLIVSAGERARLQPDWPAPSQFNHCILAIEADEAAGGLATIDHPRLGRLLVFDPTDPHTPLGLLRRSLLAGEGLLLAGELGGLIRLPEARPEGDRLIRLVRAELDGAGNIHGRIEERFHGVAASAVRGEFHMLKTGDFEKHIERRLAGTLPALRDTKIKPHDFFLRGEFALDVELFSLGYGKMMRDELLTFKPALVARRDSSQLTKKPRTLPIVVTAQACEEHAEFKLPDDCVVEEMPPALNVETEFGRYRASCRQGNGTLIFERSLELRDRELPAAEYEKVRGFFEKISRHEQTPVVLRRKPAAAPQAGAPAPTVEKSVGSASKPPGR
ncbi:MAG: hypothetical protein C0502_05490 [Opitutus sp.]|nr:hypothetical protein [Opitutus sp.]